MNPEQISAVASQLIDGFDTTAHQALGYWRTGHDRLGEFARGRWDTAFEQSKAQLSAETRKNATHCRDVFAGYYHRGFELTAGGAEVAVDTLVQAARQAVDRAVTWQQGRV